MLGVRGCPQLASFGVVAKRAGREGSAQKRKELPELKTSADELKRGAGAALVLYTYTRKIWG